LELLPISHRVAHRIVEHPGSNLSPFKQMDAKQLAAFIETGELPPALDKLN
jgi:hypothetical protein